jgi:hypothetical protein
LEVVTLQVLTGLFMACEALTMAIVEYEIQPNSTGTVGSNDQALYMIAVNIGIGPVSRLPQTGEGVVSGTLKDLGFWVGVADSACKSAGIPFCS